MKKLLSLLSVLMVGGTSTLTVVACSNSSGSSTNPDTDVNTNVKRWSQQSSNIAKSIILGKTENLNTNNILENSLKNNINNITNAGSDDTGKSYDNFAKAWGYNGTINGISSKDFNDNNANTVDNNAKNTENSIANTLASINQYLPIVQTLAPQIFANNQKFSKTIMVQDTGKYAIANLLWPVLEKHLDILNLLPTAIKLIQGNYNQLIEPLFTGLAAFDAKNTLGDQYYTGDSTEDIQNALFTNNGGWLASYKDADDNNIDSVAKKSDILYGQDKITFKDWNQVALFKAGADLNSTIKGLSGISLSDIFQKSISFDTNGNATGFSQDEFAKGLIKVYNSIIQATSGPLGVLGIVKIVEILTPIIKYKLGFEPNQGFEIVTNNKETNIKAGILNIKDIFENLNKILFTKEDFTNFFTDLFFPTAKGQYTENNFLTFDITCQTKTGNLDENNFAISQIITPIESNITSSLNSAYDTYLEPFFKENNVQDIFNKVENDIAGSNKKFDFKVSYLATIGEILKSQSLLDMANALANVKDEQSLQDNWKNIWTAAGMQDETNTDFKAGSILALLQPLATSQEFWTNISNLVSNISTSINDGFNTFIDKKESQHVDFANKTLWSIDDKSIIFSYDKQSNQSTISYKLTYNGKTYQVSVVVNTNAHDEIKNNQQVWLKSLTGLN